MKTFLLCDPSSLSECNEQAREKACLSRRCQALRRTDKEIQVFEPEMGIPSAGSVPVRQAKLMLSLRAGQLARIQATRGVPLMKPLDKARVDCGR